jgi:hypothetical protein
VGAVDCLLRDVDVVTRAVEVEFGGAGWANGSVGCVTGPAERRARVVLADVVPDGRLFVVEGWIIGSSLLVLGPVVVDS